MKYFLDFFFYLSILLILTACSNLKESLSLKKKQGVDEFLIERKSPLTVPPDFSSLPKPRASPNEEKPEEDDIDLKKVLTESKKTDELSLSDDIQKSISKILNKK